MFAFPLRTSTRYPGGFDSQTVGRALGRRQTDSAKWRSRLWTNLRTAWVQPVAQVWMEGASRCAQGEENPTHCAPDKGFFYPQAVDGYW